MSDLASKGAVVQTEAALARIEDVDRDIRAFVAIVPDRAGADAAASDARRDKGLSIGPLDGVPFAVKDNLAVAGLVTGCGTKAFEMPAEHDATVVARLRAAGAVLVGTLNMHEGALGATTDNPFWGRCMNPLRAGFSPGGSSGGSAAAIAAGMVPMTLGTDTMGSVRIPAAYCGLWGLKPSTGRVPVTGLTHLSWSLDTIGPLARDPDTLGEMLRVIEGPDDSADADVDQNSSNRADGVMPVSLRGLRFGVPDAASLADCEPVVLATFAKFSAMLEAEGVTLIPAEVVGWEPGALRRAGLLISEVEGAATLGAVVDGPGLSEEFRAMLNYGRTAKPERLVQARRQVQALAVSFDAAVTGFDGLLLPTSPQRAFSHDAPVPPGQADFTALANVAGAPALTLPLVPPDGDLPCAAQIVGPRGSDHRLIAIGALLQDLACIWRAH